MSKEHVDLQDAKFSEFGQVPVVQFLEAISRYLRIIGAGVFASIGTDSYSIGLSVFLGLTVIVAAIRATKYK
jgi:hypothetical protein